MGLNDTLANALTAILHDEKAGKSETIVSPASKIITRVLDVMKSAGYIKEYQQLEEDKGIKITLSGNINKCGVIKPRFSVKQSDFERFEKRYLLARNMGMLIISTPQGIMPHEEARKKNMGGKLLAYCY